MHPEQRNIAMQILKNISLVLLLVLCTVGRMQAINQTIPQSGTHISAADPLIRYAGRISFANPERPTFNFPGIQIEACFEGTSLRMMAKPRSGYFVARIDDGEPMKVAFTADRDSVVWLATALPKAIHHVRLMYVIEGFEFSPEFRGFILDEGCRLSSLPEAPQLKLEFVGNSITCGYGNEGIDANEHFDYATENHYLSYAAITARQLGAQHWVVARSGIGAYRNYGGPREGTPESNMQVQYEYTAYAPTADLRQQPGLQAERWDFSRYQPDVVLINLGTNDLSTNNFDTAMLKDGYWRLLKMVRSHNPQAKIVFLCGSMLGGDELQIAQRLLDKVTQEANETGDKQVYRFNFTPQDGSLGYGNDWHPSLQQHQKMADELTAFLKTLLMK